MKPESAIVHISQIISSVFIIVLKSKGFLNVETVIFLAACFGGIAFNLHRIIDNRYK